MPTGNASRLDVVLRAGETKFQAMYTGAPGDSSLKVQKASSADSVMALNPGSSPVTKKPELASANSMVAIKAGGGTPPPPPPVPKPYRKSLEPPAPANFGDKPSAMVVEDLVKKYKKVAEGRRAELEEARVHAEECAKARTKAVADYRDDQEKAADDAIATLEKMLQVKDEALDKLQNASNESLKRLDDLQKAGGESSKQVDTLKESIAKLEVEKASVQEELRLLMTSSNSARDKADVEAAAALNEAKAEGARVLAECEAKNSKSGLESAKELEKISEQLQKVTAELASEGVAMTNLQKEKREEMEKFQKAAQAACKVLGEYASWSSV